MYWCFYSVSLHQYKIITCGKTIKTIICWPDQGHDEPLTLSWPWGHSPPSQGYYRAISLASGQPDMLTVGLATITIIIEANPHTPEVKHIEISIKWLEISRQHFQIHFPNRKYCFEIKMNLNLAALVQVMAWCLSGNEPLPEQNQW